MTVSKSFPWKRLFLLTLILISAWVYYDSNQHGGFEKSITKKFLKESGLWDHGQVAIKHTVLYSRKAMKWLHENGPVYYASTKEFLQPYGELTYELFLFIRNFMIQLRDYLIEKIPVVVAFIESYAPGLVDKIVEVAQYVGHQFLHYVDIVREYLFTKVFVGQLSPANLQKATMVAFNTTQAYAIRYYDWFSQMISSID